MGEDGGEEDGNGRQMFWPTNVPDNQRPFTANLWPNLWMKSFKTVMIFSEICCKENGEGPRKNKKVKGDKQLNKRRGVQGRRGNYEPIERRELKEEWLGG